MNQYHKQKTKKQSIHIKFRVRFIRRCYRIIKRICTVLLIDKLCVRYCNLQWTVHTTNFHAHTTRIVMKSRNISRNSHTFLLSYQLPLSFPFSYILSLLPGSPWCIRVYLFPMSLFAIVHFPFSRFILKCKKKIQHFSTNSICHSKNYTFDFSYISY